MHTPFMHNKSPHGRGSAGGRLRQRLAHILTRSTCTTNTTNATAATAFVSLAKTTTDDDSSFSHHHHQEAEAPPSPYFCTPCTYERPTTKADGTGRPRGRRRSRSASLVHISVDCTGGAGGASGRRSVHSDAPLLQTQHRSVPARDIVRRTRHSKGGGGRATGKPPAARSPPSASRRHLRCSSSSTASSWGRARRPYSWSSSAASSTATDDELAPSSGSGEEEADTGTLFSSLSLSSDSTSELFYHTSGNGGGRGGSAAHTRRGHSHHRSTAARRHRHAPRRALPRASDPPAPAPDAFRPLVSVEASKKHGECGERRKKEAEKGINAKKAMEEEGTGAGMAVVKRSSNPYLDFRSSMVEMVVERRIGSVGQMEELLGSYLSLNSPRHHPAILAAFEDVWEAVFGEE